MNVRYVTGTDANRFFNADMLLDSFTRHMPGRRLSICDFGMSAGERRFWDRTGLRRAAPDVFGDRAHPWYRKAGFCDFLGDADWDAAVRLDADMILLGAIDEAVASIVRQMQRNDEDVAACRDLPERSLRRFIKDFARLGFDLGPFERLAVDLATDLDGVYLNTGFLVVRRSPFLQRWRDTVLDLDESLLFEQNAFNALAHGDGGGLRILDSLEWNVHGEALGSVAVDGRSSLARVLHATSQGQRHHIENEIEYPIGERVLAGWIKLFERADLRALQQDHMVGFLSRYIDAIDGAGPLQAPSR